MQSPISAAQVESFRSDPRALTSSNYKSSGMYSRVFDAVVPGFVFKEGRADDAYVWWAVFSQLYRKTAALNDPFVKHLPNIPVIRIEIKSDDPDEYGTAGYLIEGLKENSWVQTRPTLEVSYFFDSNRRVVDWGLRQWSHKEGVMWDLLDVPRDNPTVRMLALAYKRVVRRGLRAAGLPMDLSGFFPDVHAGNTMYRPNPDGSVTPVLTDPLVYDTDEDGDAVVPSAEYMLEWLSKLAQGPLRDTLIVLDKRPSALSLAA